MYEEWTQKIFLDGKLCDISKHVQTLGKKVETVSWKRGSVCAIYCKDNVNFITSYYYLFKNDIIPLVLKYNLPQEERSLLEADYILTDESGQVDIYQINRAEPHRYKDLQDCKVILQTSGSTGDPKHVGWSASGIHYQSIATSKILEYTADDCLAIMMPLYSAYSLSLIHIALYQNIPISLSSSLDPKDFLQMLVSSKATTLDASPELYYSILAYLEDNMLLKQELGSIRAWNCGGDILNQELALKWLAFMGKPLLDGYGLSEAGPNVAVNGPSNYRIGTVGKALEGTALKITEEGELLVKSPSIIKSYLRGKHKIIDEAGWLSTGDLVEIDSGGYLTVIGRK